MTNTYMLAGDSDPEEIVRSVPRACIAPISAAARWNHQRQLVFSTSEAISLKTEKSRGRCATPRCRHGPEALIRQHGRHDLKLDEGIGICGKAGQSVPVGLGIPPLRSTA